MRVSLHIYTYINVYIYMQKYIFFTDNLKVQEENVAANRLKELRDERRGGHRQKKRLKRKKEKGPGGKMCF